MAVDPASEYEVREALDELQRYFSDAVPPLTVADSVDLLLSKPPQLVASRIDSWAAGQGRGNSEIPMSDFLYHAVRKVHLLGEYRLLDRDKLGPWLENLKRLILQYCPSEDREILTSNLARLGEVQTGLDAPVDVVFRQAGVSSRTTASDRGASRESSGGAVGVKRLGLLLQRLEREMASAPPPGAGGGGGGPAMAGTPAVPGRPPVVWTPAASPTATQALAEVGHASRTAIELDQHLQRFKAMGVDVSADDVVKALSRFLPGWTLSYPLPEDAGPPPESSVAVAMRKVVTQSEDPAEASHRFNQLVRAAIDRFNEGSLGQAVGAIELAEKLIAEKKVDATIADAIRRNGDDPIDRDQLKKAAEKTAEHTALARFIGFFHRFSPSGILADLQVERRREFRKLLLLLAEAHGQATREAALEHLRPTLGAGVSDEEWFFRRNCVYLLRRIPRLAGAPVEEEADLVARHAELPLAPPLVREAIATLGTLKHERAEKALVRLLAETEVALSRPDSPYDRKELLAYLDRSVAALARFGTPTARRAVVEHAVNSKGTGDSVARLGELAGHNLAGEPETAALLIKALRDELPMKILGLTLKQSAKTANALRLIETLSSTPLPEVREAFRSVVERFPDTDIARAATKALGAVEHAPPAGAAAEAAAPSASLTGDLAVFGLPALLQNFSELRMSGLLSLKDPKGETFATLILKSGMLSACQMGRRRGDDAFFQIFERPAPGTFVFTRKTGEEKPDPGAKSVMPLLFEGMRRYDEFERAKVGLPDDAILLPAGAKPTPHPDEKDGMMVNAIWQAVGKGATAGACEATVEADAYRVRRQLQHWIESGALTLKA
ncbi:MAG TPA: DUF4388 domain-containing protein [Thermoanaerobaculia bacterium]